MDLRVALGLGGLVVLAIAYKTGAIPNVNGVQAIIGTGGY
jgi:hypothetical protein